MASKSAYTFLIMLIITLAVLTFYIYNRVQEIKCDLHPQYVCYTDWICDNGTGGSKNKYNVSCLLKAMYGVLTSADTAPGAACENYKIRGPNTCSSDTIYSGGTLITKPTGDGKTPPTDQCFCNSGSGVGGWDGNAVSSGSSGSCTPGSKCYDSSFAACNNLTK